ncbi:AraC family transcriptional regulator [Planctobacterium marinum]|uniref:AraC family transcriptional regulator n=1 Tax=Planctobacterium marinum TaxID=1631968 RepID=A0AA48I4J0_9ALTE|nr:AraC family transcriptional regulator [Planctobacterium marinum]
MQIVHYFLVMSTAKYNELLHYLKLESVYYSRSLFGGVNWAVNVPAYPDTSMFHILVSGSCLVKLDQIELLLKPGDVVFFPAAKGHFVMGNENTDASDLYSLPVKKISDLYETLELNSEASEKTVLLCGVVKIRHPSGEMLLNDMPPIIHVQREHHLFSSVMEGIVNLIFQEAEANFLGGETVITRLVDILMIQTIRQWVMKGDEYHGQWLKALKDPKIGKSLSLIHQHPEITWTIESLGKDVGMSRTAFATQFTLLVGDTPMNYLTSWRMNLAELRIKSGEKVTLDFIESLGYQSESSFRRAFKKIKGYTTSNIPKELPI